MDTLGIEAFLAIVRHGSLTEAANSLFLSQSTLSHRLAELEREIGFSLIDRGRGFRSLTLTDYGKDFLIIAKRWEALIEDTKRIQPQTSKLSLSIGAVDTIHTFVLPPVYHHLRQNMPGMNIRLKTHNSTELYLQVDRGEIDVAFPLIDLPMKNILVQKFYAEPRVILRKEQNAGECGGSIAPQSLDLDAEIFFEGDLAFHRWHDQWRGSKGPPSLCVDTAQLLLPLLQQEGAWSIVPFCMARKIAAAGAFVYYRLKDSPPERICYRIQSQYPKSGALESIQKLDTCLASLSLNT